MILIKKVFGRGDPGIRAPRFNRLVLYEEFVGNF